MQLNVWLKYLAKKKIKKILSFSFQLICNRKFTRGVFYRLRLNPKNLSGNSERDKMNKTFFISQSTSLTLVIIISLLFVVFGIYHSKKFQGINNYLTANRNIGLFSLTTSLVASALGAWILFGPASASTWGGIGAVIG